MSLKQRNRLLITACILLTIVAVLTVLANRGHLGDLFGPPPKEKQKHQAQRENDSDQQKSPPRPEGEASAKRNRVATDTPPPGSSAPKLGSGTRHALGPRRPPAG